MRLLQLSLLLLLVSLSAPLLAQAPELSQAELSWIREHPRITYTVRDTWPQEIISNDLHRGISREVLDDISRRTGLQFIFVPSEQAARMPPVMLTAVNTSLLNREERQRWLFTFPWANTMPMIVSKKEATGLRTLSQLEGKRIAVVNGSDYIPWLRDHFPGIRLSVEPDILSALNSVDKGENEAAIASGLVMLPILQRHYLHRLAIIAQIPEMASGISMAVNPAYPVLRDILNKSMAHISADEAQSMFMRWIGIVDIGTPTLIMVLWQYRYPLILIAVLIVLLLISVRVALVSRRQAIRSEQHKSDFLAMMSHEIRTPMNAIIAALELLTQTDNPARIREFTSLAHSSSQDLLDLLNSVLDHEKISRNQLVLQPEPLQPRTILEAVCDTQRPAAQRKGLSLMFTSSLSDDDRWWLIDPHRLRQIANNLLSNAIKFTEQGCVHLSVGEADGFLNIQVEDTGSGIPKFLLKRLTGAWQQGEHEGEGSGLGLYICRSLAEQMKGSLMIKSEPGQGTCVSLSLPLTACAAPDRTTSAVRMGLPDFAGACSVLVVEDHAANRRVLAEQLTQLNCHFDMAEDGERALAFIEDECYYDVVLLDCGLPGISGYTVARRLRLLEEQQGREGTVIIAISAQGSSQHIAASLESGMNDVLTKPIRLTELAKTLKQWCQPVGSQGVEPPAARSVPDDILPALQDDLRAFVVAAQAGEQREMIHYIHRIRGVAQMYHLDMLAGYATDLEAALREELPFDTWAPSRWIHTLRHLIITGK